MLGSSAALAMPPDLYVSQSVSQSPETPPWTTGTPASTMTPTSLCAQLSPLVRHLRRRFELHPKQIEFTVSVDELRRLTAFIGTPLYRGRNSTYMTVQRLFLMRWVVRAEEKIAQAVTSELDRT